MLPITTARLRIDALKSTDAPALRAITDDPAIIAAIHFLSAPFTLGNAEALIRGHVHGVERFLGVWQGMNLIGVVGTGNSGDALEVGYWFGTKFWRQRFASEAVGAVVAALQRENPGRDIVAECRRENRASWRLLERLGFRASGRAGERPGRERLILSGPPPP
ncbi:MAG TPA: GNAT family N-acetyltransferase [Stellaceae bacterium]|nr:GNAT family N-acetyltransferase [Stellaceae bacterium]